MMLAVAEVAAGRACVLATVVSTARSVPRRAGSKMVVLADGRAVGSIGGGEMEARVLAEARAALADRRPRLATFDLVDPATGDAGVCGGTATIYVEPLMPTATVYVIGCGHVGKAVADLAHWSGFRVVVWDDRGELVSPEVVPSADACLTGTIADALASEPITSETHIVVVTRNISLDRSILPPLLAAGARSVGIMGSVRRWATTRAQLAADGVPAEQLDAVTNPIGIELNAETPEEIAVSIIAEIVRNRRTQK
jgi:xanthine dehydrogenase accessory factor